MRAGGLTVGLGTTMIEPGLTGGRLDGIGVYTSALMRHLPRTGCSVVPYSWPRVGSKGQGISIGQPMPLRVEVKEHALEPGDLILICSDGITRSIPDSVIARHLEIQREPVLSLGALISASLERGGSDNATGVLCRIDSL